MRFTSLLPVFLAGLTVSACATSGAVPRPYPGAPARGERPGPPDAATAASPPAGAPSPLADEIVRGARDLVGAPYLDGGVGPDGFDCSGLVQYVCAAAGARVPRSVREQWQTGTPVAPEAVAPGDLVFFAIDGRQVSHVGIALGDGLFLHAPSSGGVVRVERLTSPYWARRYAGARRIGTG